MEKKEYIERGALIDAIEGTDWYHIGERGNLVHGAISDGNALYKADDVFEVLNKLSAADVVEVVHGEWIHNPRREYDYICSICRGDAPEDRMRNNAILTPYCPHCGAKMDGGEHETEKQN